MPLFNLLTLIIQGGKNKMKKVKKLQNISEWYVNVIQEAKLVDYSPVKGCLIIRPYGYAIWENIQNILDKEIKKQGCENVYFPLFIPQSFLSKEKEHVKGFAPECAIVTHAGGKQLEEPLVVRPTSETIMYHTFAKWIKSWRDLPLKVNQWCNVVRWEKRTLPFFRTTEFLWQEAHTVHSEFEESDQQAKDALEMYRQFIEDYLAIPVILGKKSESEKFAGALYSVSCEALMPDGKALQSATAHNLGQNFSKVFEVVFQDKDKKNKYVWQTSWGLSTRIIGGLVMVHGDDQGLILPPKIAPFQVIIIPIWKNSQEKKVVRQKLDKITGKLKNLQIRFHVDDKEEYSPGWKFNEWELKGVPLRLEIGPRDVGKNQIIAVRRDTAIKEIVAEAELENKVVSLLECIQKELFQRALQFREQNTCEITEFKDFQEAIKHRKLVYAPWCGKAECEATIKEQTKATTRCIPFDNGGKIKKEKCVFCGQKAQFRPVWGRAY